MTMLLGSREKRVKARLFGVLALLAAFGPFATDMYLPALIEIEKDLGAAQGAAQGTLSIFFLAAGLGQLLYGPLSDRAGRRVPLLCGTALFVVASLACVFVESIGEMMFWRFLTGLGASSGMVLSRAVIRDKFDGDSAADAFSLMMVVMGAAPILAPLCGGQLLLVAPWRHVFSVLAGIGLAAWAGVWFGLPESLPKARRAQTRILGGGIFQNYVSLLRDKRFLGLCLVQGFNAGAFFAYITCSSRVFIGDFGVSSQTFAFFFGVNSLGLLGASWLNRRLLRRHPPGEVLGAGLAVVMIVGFLLALAAFTGTGGLALLAVLLFLTVASNGMVSPNSTALALAPHGHNAGAASALLGALQFAVGGLAGGVAAAFGGGTVPMSIAICVCSTAAFAAYWLSRDTRRAPSGGNRPQAAWEAGPEAPR
ncbi:MAG: multidrug effflux MFS transporter [Puniceicoccales bacterium]|jgi:DHA1 family bicyclomycin/chloramphenicol resistance-like MFS transporter|nr:multidrug effflux MFS transporter [Puniceicoccales bacterium]